ncbi:MAG: malto-oligosyltrehalose synthase, partial [Alphaproteobacteria bacterium]|nr:malto-oligosyltrehalose synthase [Alphaproteobacteria bacterium]
MIPFTATYRLQLREGVDFAAAERYLPHLKANGISHLYLSPIFAAQTGSTHGYDVIDPNVIEPSLGGDDGFARLAAAAQAAGIGIIIDIVPNHTAFSLENPWLRDVLR